MISYARLTYSSGNLGDDIQTLATLPFLGPHPSPFERDTLALHRKEGKYILIMNGWWADRPEQAFPPSNCFIPVFIGFHITPRWKDYFTSPVCIDYFKKHQPIGCRDLFTENLLKEKGVKTFFSGCLSTTFEKRNTSPYAESIYLVDTERIDYLIPENLKKNATRLTHQFTGNHELREYVVRELMDHYHNKATLVITTRLHAALPCAALGIPVILFFHPDDPRASTATQIGLPVHQHNLNRPKWIKKIHEMTRTKHLWTWYEKRALTIRYSLFKKINWNPEPIEFEDHKRRLQKKTHELVHQLSSD